MNDKDSFYHWVEQNDSYPEHSHKWIAGVYNKYKGVEAIHRYFGVFQTQQQAREWASKYKDKYTTEGFITSIRVFPICEVIE